jgi:hypothetical protein
VNVRDVRVTPRPFENGAHGRPHNLPLDSSIPHYIRFPVETPEDWKAMKERFRFDEPERRIPEEEIANLRREFGMELRMRGGIGKEPLVRGGRAIDRELDRIKPLLEQGGFVPHLDHLVPPDIPYRNYCEYLEKKRKLIGKQ